MLHLARPGALGQRGESPDEPRVAPRARLISVDPARRVELLRIAHQALDEWLEPLVIAVPGEGDVSHDAPDEAGRAVIPVEDPVHPAAPGATEFLEDVAGSTPHARVARVDAVLDEQKIHPVARLVFGAP